MYYRDFWLQNFDLAAIAGSLHWPQFLNFVFEIL